MGKYISFEKPPKKYLLLVFYYFIFSILCNLIKSIFNIWIEESDTDKRENYIIETFIFSIGISLLFIPELFLKKKSFQSNKTSDFKYKYKIKDIFFIGLIYLLILLHNFGNIFLEAYILERTKEEILSYFYSLDYLFIFIISILYFKNTHYKHQYISLSIIIILTIIRNLIKLGQYNFFSFNGKDIIIESFLIILKSSTNSLFNAFFKILIEKYYFSIYKILYLFGFINAIIFLILIFIFTYIPCGQNFLCSIEYDNKFYF